MWLAKCQLEIKGVGRCSNNFKLVSILSDPRTGSGAQGLVLEVEQDDLAGGYWLKTRRQVLLMTACFADTCIIAYSSANQTKSLLLGPIADSCIHLPHEFSPKQKFFGEELGLFLEFY